MRLALTEMKLALDGDLQNSVNPKNMSEVPTFGEWKPIYFVAVFQQATNQNT